MADIEVEWLDGKTYEARITFVPNPKRHKKEPLKLLAAICGRVGDGALIWVSGLLKRQELQEMGYVNVKVRPVTC